MKSTRSLKQVELKSKSQTLHERITLLAYELGPGARLPRVMEMCRDFNVATHTLNHALREVEKDGLIVRRQGSGVFVTENATGQNRNTHLALICRPSFFRATGHSPIWDLLVQIIQERAAQSGIEFDCYFSREVGATPPLSEAVSHAVEQRLIGGVLGVGLPESAARWIMSNGIPVVNLFGPGHVTMMLDTKSIVRQGIEELKKRGCQHIGLWLGVFGLENEEIREYQRTIQREIQEFFRAEMESNGLRYLPELVENKATLFESSPNALPSLAEQGFQTARRVFGNGSSMVPDGIVVIDDTVTQGVVQALRSLNLKIGRDIQVASHVNSGLIQFMDEDDLIRIEIDTESIVTQMFNRMDQLLSSMPLSPENEEFISIQAQVRNRA